MFRVCLYVVPFLKFCCIYSLLVVVCSSDMCVYLQHLYAFVHGSMTFKSFQVGRQRVLLAYYKAAAKSTPRAQRSFLVSIFNIFSVAKATMTYCCSIAKHYVVGMVGLICYCFFLFVCGCSCICVCCACVCCLSA